VESDNTKFVNSGSYGKRYRGSRWSTDETERFYDVSLRLGMALIILIPNRLSLNLVKTMSLLPMYYLVAIGSPVKINSR
jgi:hypothetical protein